MSNESKILQEIFTQLQSDTKTFKIDLLAGYIDHFANDSVNKYDRGFSLSSIKLKEILARNKFQTKLRRLGYKLSKDGDGYGIAIFRYKGKSYIDVVKTHNPVFRFGRLVDVYFDTDESITIKDSNKDRSITLQGRFYYDEKGKVQKQVGFYNQGQWIVKEEDIEYDTDEIPVALFTNNSLKTPDIRTESRLLIKQAGEFINRIPDEFEKGKIIFAFNNLINSTNNGKDFKDRIIKGKESVYDLTDPDGMIANNIAPMSYGMSTVEMIERIYGFYDARARELSFQFRDHGSDSRKSEFDLMLFNQKPFEYMMSKISHRQEQLQSFIDLLAKIERTKTAKITLVISEFEQNRIDNLKAITDLKVAQSLQAKAIGKKNVAEAIAISSGNATPVDPTAVKTDLKIDDINTKGV